jgi:hypothetical protein
MSPGAKSVESKKDCSGLGILLTIFAIFAAALHPERPELPSDHPARALASKIFVRRKFLVTSRFG